MEELDRAIAKKIKPFAEDRGILVVVAANHYTPSSGPLVHSGELTPLIFHGNGVRVDDVGVFNEISAANGALGKLRQKELFYMILNYLDRSKLIGTMHTPVDQLFWPGNFQPFRINMEK